MEKTIHVLNGHIVNEGVIREGHLVIRAGRIQSISSNLPTGKADKVIDVCGAWILPGLIDDQVHFREPGFPKKGTIRTESMAAVAGGVTSYMEMPNTYPPTTDKLRLEEKHAIAQVDSFANYSFYLGATQTNLDEIRKVDRRRVPGIKIFMGSSTGNMKVSEPEILEKIFQEATLPVVTHCEDDDMIAGNFERYKAVWGEDIPARYHPDIRSREACFKSTSLAIELAKRNQAQLHVLHITTAEELQLFDTGPLEGKSITAEACVHHLHYNDSYYAKLGHRIKCNPSIKKETDRLALIKAINEGQIDVIATDHAPHELEHKLNPYPHAPSGLPLVQHTLSLLLEHVRTGELSIEKVVEKTSHAVAKRFNITERGYIREGYWADLVVCRILDNPWLVAESEIYSRCGWSTFEKESFYGKVEHTFVSGNHIFADGRIVNNPVGLPLVFNR
jgi:dihydroorotase